MAGKGWTRRALGSIGNGRRRKVCRRRYQEIILYLLLLSMLVSTALIHLHIEENQLDERLFQGRIRRKSNDGTGTSGSFPRVGSGTGTGASLGAIVFLAPPRNSISIWGVDRFCLLLRAVRSVNDYINVRYGPYPIIIVVAKDYDLHKSDAYYTNADRNLLRRWAPNSTIEFQEINLYSEDALEPNTTRDQIIKWRQGDDGSIPGRDLGYASMCRLWSGRIQTMSFLRQYRYYMRMDDDSLLLSNFPFDPFQKMKINNLTYAYRRVSADYWGIDQLWEVSKPYINMSNDRLVPFLFGDGSMYSGMQPYNNFHVALTSFWQSTEWMELWTEFNRNHLFFKYRVGDANVHAIAMMLMDENQYDTWPDIPYVHNSNDWPGQWEAHTKQWTEECRIAYKQ